MNNKIAFSLICGCVFAIAGAWLTSTIHYYFDNGHQISKQEYYEYYNSNDDRVLKEVKYNDTFIIIALIGGIGAGYLLYDSMNKAKKH